MPTTKFCQGISDISDSYNAFIVDQWGVIHNGEVLYPDVTDCLKEMRGRKKAVILLSNSEMRADESADFLKNMGLSSNLYDAIVTSGELTWQGLQHRNEGIFKDLPPQLYLIGGERARQFLKGLSIEVVDDIADAKCILIAGWDMPDREIASYEDILKKAIQKRMRALCMNPDSRALLGAQYKGSAGLIARRYQEMGGVVYFIGKPHKPILQHCVNILQKLDIYPGQTVVIGDTMAHDVLGGALMNMDTCLIKNGLHLPVFRNAKTPADVNKTLNILTAQYNHVHPTYLVDRLKWGKALPDRKHKNRKGREMAFV